jgi:ribonuclease J
MKEKKLRIIPLGGLGEVGKNMMAYEYNGRILIVDTGLMFPENDMLGIDYIIPDFSYLLDKKDKVDGIVITHGHEDHTGAIHHVLQEINAPIYATPLTRGLVEVKLGRNGLASRAVLNTVHAGDKVEIGPFSVEFFHVCHSIPDGVGLGITTPLGLIVHSGDYKFDHTPVDGWPSDYSKLADFSSRGVLALLSDSTNSERPGWTPSEKVIDDAFRKVFREAQSRIIIVSFASLISRMQQAINVAAEFGRKLAFAGMSMVENAKMAGKLGYLDIPEDVLIPIDQALNMPGKDVVIMCTGSQGEPSSILGRLSMGTNRQFDIKDGDTVVLSSHPIPGNEESIYRMINRLFQLGANVIYEAIANVHVSGHASQEEMKLLLHLVQPKYFIPIHGELRQLKQHAVLAQDIGIKPENILVSENGQVIEISENGMKLAEKVPAGYVFVDGSGVGDVSEDIMRERETLARDGIVLLNVNVDRFTGEALGEPEVISRGFISSRENSELYNGLKKKVMESIKRNGSKDRNEIEQACRTYINSETRRRPVVMVSIGRS